MSNQGNYNGNGSNNNGRRSIGGSNNGNGGNYGNNNYSNNSGNKYAKYGSGSNYNPGGYNNSPNSGNNNGNDMNNRYANKYGSSNVINELENKYNNVAGLDGEYDSMNLSMDETSLEEIAAAKKADRKAKIKLGIKIASISLLTLILVAGIFIYVKYGADIMKLREEALEAVSKTNEETFTKSSASKYYAKQNGKWVQIEFASSTTYKYMSLTDGGENMQFACDLMYLSEDRNFYKHKGVDIMANVKAVILAIMNGGEVERGGSTITQQLSRNVILEDFDRTWKRKVREIFISWELEKEYNKDQIMEFYLNNINFSNGYVGIESAARGYFGKSITKLTKAQVAFLCSIPNNPTLYNPHTKIENTISRSKRLVKQVYEYGEDRLDKKEYTAIIGEADTIKVISEEETSKDTKTVKIDLMLKQYIMKCAQEKIVSGYMELKSASDFTNAADREQYEITYDDWMQKAAVELSKKGYYIYTSIDLDMQKSLQDNIDTKVKSFPDGKKLKKDKTYLMQSAGVCIDNATGCVTAMVNSRTTEGIRNEMPRAYGMETTSNGKTTYLGVNQPGSAIKPILVYGPAFDLRDETSGKALYTNNSIVDDTGEEPREGADPVGNSHGYKGMVSIQEAIKGSSNVAAYRLYRDMYTNVKRSYAFNYLNKLNFQFLAQKDKTDLGVSIGGFAWGSTPLEMCAAYATIANDGEYRRPTAVLTVQSSANVANPLQFDESTIKGALTKSKKIYEQSTARRLTVAMQEVLTGSKGVYSGTAAGKGVSLDSAGKTGTTNGNRDAWFCGYTPCYTTSIWVGKDTNEKTSVQGGSVASIWKAFNQAVINKKKLSPSDYSFNLVIMDDSEPEEEFSLEPTETIFDFTSPDPLASLFPTDEWSETEQAFTIEPYTETPTTDPWITNPPDPGQPSNDGNGGGPNTNPNEGEGPSSEPGFDPNNGNSHGQHNGN